MKEKKAEIGLNYDSVLEYLGQFGCFQRRMFLCMCLVSFLTGPPTVIFAFTGESGLVREVVYISMFEGYELGYRCPVTSCGETSQSKYSSNETEAASLPPFYEENFIQLADRCKVPQPRSASPGVGNVVNYINSRNEDNNCGESQLSFRSNCKFVRGPSWSSSCLLHC